jgi:hypothetical protein
MKLAEINKIYLFFLIRGGLNKLEHNFKAKIGYMYSRHGDIVIMYSVPYLSAITIVTVSGFRL